MFSHLVQARGEDPPAPTPSTEDVLVSNALVPDDDASWEISQEFLFFGGGPQNNAPKRDAAKPLLYGVEQVQLTPPTALPHIQIAKDGDQDIVHVFYFGGTAIRSYSGALRMNHHVIQLLDRAKEDTKFIFHIDSPGGHLTVASNVISAMRRTRGHVTTVGVGDVMSAAAAIWYFGHERVAHPSSLFMFHFSSHGGFGNSRQLQKASETITENMVDLYIRPVMDEGLLTKEEFDLILAGEDVFIDGFEMGQRLKTVSGRQVEDPETPVEDPPAAPAEGDGGDPPPDPDDPPEEDITPDDPDPDEED